MKEEKVTAKPLTQSKVIVSGVRISPDVLPGFKSGKEKTADKVMQYLTTASDDYGVHWASYVTIAASVEMHVPNVVRTIGKLVKNGYLQKIRRTCDAVGVIANGYKILKKYPSKK
jgi:hypothetical protein